MFKGLPNADAHPTPIQADIPADTQKENTNLLIETAAEQFAILLWKTWLHNRKSKNTKHRENEPKSRQRAS